MEPKVYNYDDAYNASLKYFGGDELAARVWVSKYAPQQAYSQPQTYGEGAPVPPPPAAPAAANSEDDLPF